MSIDRLAEETRSAVKVCRRAIRATYRLQLHAGFCIEDARSCLPYFDSLGVSHLYTSPLLAAKSGSRHGYDVRNHDLLNPEIGSEEQFEAWSRELRSRNMGLVVDVVPNHMCVGCENPWWADVLEQGPSSFYAGYFDIAWNDHPQSRLHGKVLLPILGEPYGQVLESGRFRPGFEGGAFFIQFDCARLPIDPRTYSAVLNPVLESIRSTLDPEDSSILELQSILAAISHLPSREETDGSLVAAARSECTVIKRRLAELVERDGRMNDAIHEALDKLAGTPGDPQSFTPLEQWLDSQAYRLCFWRVASDEINYRRFFDINEFAAISTEREDVFWASHRKLFEWQAAGEIDGLRIDHPDGLYNPREYLHRLQLFHKLGLARRLLDSRASEFPGLTWDEAEPELRKIFDADTSRPLFVVVEKILGPSEPLPADWETEGTTGYELLNAVNGLFIDTRGEAALSAIYEEFTGQDDAFEEIVYQKKFLILQTTLASELHMLAHQLDRLAQQDRWSRDFTLNGLRHALREVIACFPVYRSYVDGSLRDSDRNSIIRAIVRARRRNPVLGVRVFDFIRDRLLLKDPPSAPATDDYRQAQERFAGKFQQVTAPVMAKGFEDTALYIYNRLVSLNEVGGHPTEFGRSPSRLHELFAERAVRTPEGLSPLTTHDTKRSEDVRARINVLAEIPEEWGCRVKRWSEMNARFKTELEGGLMIPDRNEEYLLYQTLVGAWPLGDYSARAAADLTERIRAYMNKAAHEAKVYTSWINPDPVYDEALARFVENILDPNVSSEFVADLCDLQKRIAPASTLNSLAQKLVQCLAPGVPDIYQGTELWDFSLVDPDNRRPVDFALRQNMLRGLDERSGADRSRLIRELLANPDDGRVKMYITADSLRLRRELADLFAKGQYVPLNTAGERKDHVFAFSWRRDREAVIAAVPRLTFRLPRGRDRWADTYLILPDELAGLQWRNRFTGAVLPGADRLLAKDLFDEFPIALLVAMPTQPQPVHDESLSTDGEPGPFTAGKASTSPI
jgi:(1->4)-alpha-D-glucan 1-alpha-D-glucosylmutase